MTQYGDDAGLDLEEFSVLTPATAPRTVEELASVSSFKLRLLADRLGLLSTKEQKMDWAWEDTEARAAAVLETLHKWDKENNPLPGELAGEELLAETERRMTAGATRR